MTQRLLFTTPEPTERPPSWQAAVTSALGLPVDASLGQVVATVQVLRIRADQVPTLEADLQRAHERADKAEAEKRWAIESSTQAVGEAVKFAQQQIDVLTAERDAAQARSESFRRTLAGTANDLALALGVADQGLAWAELVALVRSRAANREREVKRLTAHLEIADEQIEAVRKMEQASYQQLEARHLEEIERLRAQVCALAEDRDRAVKLAFDCAPAAEVPAGWPEGWTLDAGRDVPPAMLARAQGFPDSYILTGTKSEQVARIGNSVCPPVAEALVRAQFPSLARRAA